VAWSENSIQEYADLEMMQMLGRAGRPQFERSACAVILTREHRVDHFRRLVSGQEPLESCLHLNLIDHLNAEVGLGTVSDLAAAKRWLASTFLFVRLGRNPKHYRLKEEVAGSNDVDLLDQICSKDIQLLQQTDLVTKDEKLMSTEFGDAMSRYYVKFETMKIFMSQPPKVKISEIVSTGPPLFPAVEADPLKDVCDCSSRRVS
jgi:ATP-dependent DNA helicase HFM1/MER3